MTDLIGKPDPADEGPGLPEKELKRKDPPRVVWMAGPVGTGLSFEVVLLT